MFLSKIYYDTKYQEITLLLNGVSVASTSEVSITAMLLLLMIENVNVQVLGGL
jgi:hypothetical protein